MRYNRLRQRFQDKADRKRVIENLMALREQLDQDVPRKDADDHLLLGTWNIRDLGKKHRWGYGKRTKESFFYIAEILSRFDLVAVQEVNELWALEVVMDLLGPDWDYIATDVTDRSLGGNGERLTYVFDKRKVDFQNIAGEIVLPKDMLISQVEFEGEEDDDSKKLVAGKQFRRSPFVTRFQSGWLKFDLCSVHIYYGSNYGDKLDERIDEIRQVASYMSERADRGLKEGRATFLLGDFNIMHPEHETMEALTDSGFEVPKPLRNETRSVGECTSLPCGVRSRGAERGTWSGRGRLGRRRPLPRRRTWTMHAMARSTVVGSSTTSTREVSPEDSRRAGGAAPQTDYLAHGRMEWGPSRNVLPFHASRLAAQDSFSAPSARISVVFSYFALSASGFRALRALRTSALFTTRYHPPADPANYPPKRR